MNSIYYFAIHIILFKAQIFLHAIINIAMLVLQESISEVAKRTHFVSNRKLKLKVSCVRSVPGLTRRLSAMAENRCRKQMIAQRQRYNFFSNRSQKQEKTSRLI